MDRIFDHQETTSHSYFGWDFEEEETIDFLAGPVSEILYDSEIEEEFISDIETAISALTDTGFQVPEDTLEDLMQDLNEVNKLPWKIGEAFAEATLEEHFNADFYWNERRDQKNPKSSETGADLVGFASRDSQKHFLFGEVKTSSQDSFPPTVVTKQKDGLQAQLNDIRSNSQKRSDLIRYIANKARLFDNDHPFKMDYDEALQTYIRNKKEGYTLVGVLVRDLQPNEDDLKDCFFEIQSGMTSETSLELYAYYLPVPSEEWNRYLNEGDNNA